MATKMATQPWSTVTPLHPPSSITDSSHSTPDPKNPLPQLLHTPSGLAIIELQGTINFTQSQPEATQNDPASIGRLVFPLYTPGISDPKEGPWMKRVYFYIGKHQRMTGEIKKLAKPMAVLRKARQDDREDVNEIEIADIIWYKIVFMSRPEPVSADMQ